MVLHNRRGLIHVAQYSSMPDISFTGLEELVGLSCGRNRFRAESVVPSFIPYPQ